MKLSIPNEIGKTLSRILTGTVMAGFIGMSATPALADTTPQFNGQANDPATLQVRKLGQPTWSGSVSAAANDVVELLVWDHNSVPDSVADNVTIKVSLPSGAATTFKPTATVSASNAQSVTGSATITTAETSHLEYVAGSAKFLRNINDAMTVVDWPSGITPNNVVTTGVNLGSQEGCWQYAQAVMIQVKIVKEVIPPTLIPLAITKQVRPAGSTLNYTDSITVLPGTDVQYKVVVTNNDNSVDATAVTGNDVLPQGVAPKGQATVLYPDGKSQTLPTSYFSSTGVSIATYLHPHQSVVITFLASTLSTFQDGQKVTNVAYANASNAIQKVQDEAYVNFQIPKVNLAIAKEVRRNVDGTAFAKTISANPGDQLVYKVTIRNVDGGVSLYNVRAKDVLPNDVTYLGPTVLTLADGTTKTLANTLTTENTLIVNELKPSQSIALTFVAVASTHLSNGDSRVNKVCANADNAINEVCATAEVQFIKSTPTPAPTATPTAAPTATPKTTLPTTGADTAIPMVGGFAGISGYAVAFYRKRQLLKKSIRSLDIR